MNQNSLYNNSQSKSLLNEITGAECFDKIAANTMPSCHCNFNKLSFVCGRCGKHAFHT